jgi:methylthioribose-1-phosphate isomerase
MHQLASEALKSAATVIGIARTVQRASSETAAALLQTGSILPDGPAALSAKHEPPRPTIECPYRVEPDRILILDQTRYPTEVVLVECLSGADVARAMRDRLIDGASVLAQVAALGLALTANRLRDAPPEVRRATLRATLSALGNSRPGGGALKVVLNRLERRCTTLDEGNDRIADALHADALAFVADAALHEARLAEVGAALLRQSGAERLVVLTLGLTGTLSTGGGGTVLGVIRAARASGQDVSVHVLETRPVFQGSRLTAWELSRDNIPYTVEADSAIGWLLAKGEISAILVGAERIAANGDLAATIGTYPLAVLARHHSVPIYACASTTTIDLETQDGAALPLEYLPARSLLRVGEYSTAPEHSIALVPGLDVCPAEFVTGFITEQGIMRPPFGSALAEAMRQVI